MQEIWKNVPGYENMYQVSNLGKVKSLARYKKAKSNSKSLTKEKLLRFTRGIDGYISYELNKNSIRKNFKAHRLVAMAFIPNPENKPQVNHINGVKDDNRVENLEWNTASENVRHSYKTGLASNKGERHPLSKLNNSQVLKIRNDNRKLIEIASEYNLSMTTISEIKKRKTWNHI
jgi:hypothetical protein